MWCYHAFSLLENRRGGTLNKNRFSLRALLVGVTFFCIAVFLFRLIVWPWLLPFTHGYWEEVSDQYALWQTQEMISLFISTNPGEIPSSWEELRKQYNDTNQSYGTPGLSSLKARVVVDFLALSETARIDFPQNERKKTPVIRIKARVKGGVMKLTPEEEEVNLRIRNSLRTIP